MQSVTNNQVASSHSAGCTAGCTGPASDANLDLLAAVVAVLTPEQRAKLAAMLTG
ncbi:MAG TPA: hypothetical protein VG406_09800 [Isosphaeraceae bacterium]|nr:hypothetical protein [Isosphaeraceae bacterium]